MSRQGMDGFLSSGRIMDTANYLNITQTTRAKDRVVAQMSSQKSLCAEVNK